MGEGGEFVEVCGTDGAVLNLNVAKVLYLIVSCNTVSV